MHLCGFSLSHAALRLPDYPTVHFQSLVLHPLPMKCHCCCAIESCKGRTVELTILFLAWLHGLGCHTANRVVCGCWKYKLVNCRNGLPHTWKHERRHQGLRMLELHPCDAARRLCRHSWPATISCGPDPNSPNQVHRGPQTGATGHPSMAFMQTVHKRVLTQPASAIQAWAGASGVRPYYTLECSCCIIACHLCDT